MLKKKMLENHLCRDAEIFEVFNFTFQVLKECHQLFQ